MITVPPACKVGIFFKLKPDGFAFSLAAVNLSNRVLPERQIQ